MSKQKITKPSKNQAKHIEKPFRDKSGEKTKESKTYAKVNAREHKKFGRTKPRPVKLNSKE